MLDESFRFNESFLFFCFAVFMVDLFIFFVRFSLSRYMTRRSREETLINRQVDWLPLAIDIHSTLW